jgi:hypothetical protein
MGAARGRTSRSKGAGARRRGAQRPDAADIAAATAIPSGVAAEAPESREGTAKSLVGPGYPPVEHRFRPGQSGNPKGRPPGVALAARKLIGKNGERALQFLADLMDGKALKITALERGKPRTLDVQKPSVRERRYAAQELLNRACGRSTQIVEVSGPSGGPVTTLDLGRLSDAQLEQLGALLSAAEGAEADAPEVGGGQSRAGA